MRVHFVLVLVVLCVPLLIVGSGWAGSISIGLPGDGTTVVTLPDGVVVLDAVAVKKRVENLKDVTYSASMVIDDEKLAFEGTIGSGQLKDGELKLKSSAELSSKFTSEGLAYKLILQPGDVEAEIKGNELRRFSGTLEFEADLTIRDEKVAIEGTLDAEYGDGEFGFEGSFILDEPLEIIIGPALLTLGTRFEFKAGLEEGFSLLPETDDEVVVAFVGGDDKEPFVLGCLWNGSETLLSDSDGTDGKGWMYLKEAVEFDSGKVTVRLPKGETVEVEIEDSELIDLRLDGVRFEAEAFVDGKKRTVKGKIKDGSYDPDSETITLEAKEFEDLGVKKIEIKIAAPEDPPSTEE